MPTEGDLSLNRGRVARCDQGLVEGAHVVVDQIVSVEQAILTQEAQDLGAHVERQPTDVEIMETGEGMKDGKLVEGVLAASGLGRMV